jgi:outer membrane lipopolysaccharide assembly protein LptE/RlpB
VTRGASLTAAAALASLLSGVVACGYRLAGTGSVLPEHVKVIAVLPFSNRTERPEIEQRVTEAVAQELSRRGGYEVVTDPAKADAVLEGVVTSYRTIPVEFTREGRESRSEATLTIQATLRDADSDAVLWNQSGLVFKEQYEISEVESGEFFDRETLALDELARGVAGALATSMFEGF